jgi:hypothetical protein
MVHSGSGYWSHGHMRGHKRITQLRASDVKLESHLMHWNGTKAIAVVTDALMLAVDAVVAISTESLALVGDGKRGWLVVIFLRRSGFKLVRRSGGSIVIYLYYRWLGHSCRMDVFSVICFIR